MANDTTGEHANRLRELGEAASVVAIGSMAMAGVVAYELTVGNARALNRVVLAAKAALFGVETA